MSKWGLDSATTTSRLNNPAQPTSWYEQIQFKAQYHHLRTNNYAAIVQSLNSLDKVTLPKVTVTAPKESSSPVASVSDSTPCLSYTLNSSN